MSELFAMGPDAIRQYIYQIQGELRRVDAEQDALRTLERAFEAWLRVHEEKEALRVTQRRRAMENAASHPDIGLALDEADRAYEGYLKGLKLGE